MRHVYQIERPPSLEKLQKYKATVADRARLEYYLGTNAFDGQTPFEDPEIKTLVAESVHKQLASHDRLTAAVADKSILLGYSAPLLILYKLLPGNYQNARFLYKWGDNIEDLPSRGWIAKTRLRGTTNVTLLKLNAKRHYALVHKVAAQDLPFEDKIDKAVWRGRPTGIKGKGAAGQSGDRLRLVLKDEESPLFDFGFSTILLKKGNRASPLITEKMAKGALSLKQQLAYKVLVSVEGNDVASGLKWMMASNSVVVMSKPTVCSWFMEDTLEPYVHYVPAQSDYSDLESQVRWCLDHEAECLQIIKNAQKFVAQFMDPVREIYLEREVFRTHLDVNGDWTQPQTDKPLTPLQRLQKRLFKS